MRKIRIANCGGFWGDDPTAARRQVDGGPIDYLVMDYLAEVTMAILHKQMSRDPEKGYAGDFLVQLRDVLVDVVERDITVISNAGGVNPLGAKAAVEKLAADLGVADRVRVGVVMGDDIYPQLDDILAGGEALTHLESGEPLSDIRDRVLSANVYLGAAPVVRALEMGANVIITGRVTDTGVTLAPMIHEFGWDAHDWDRISSGVVAGHIIECGLQATGGNFTDWEKVPSWTNMGYPIVEAHEDGTFVVTKHDGTGGLVSVHTVTEQLLYEMGSPAYLCPDATARFDSIALSQDGDDRVAVSGVVGGPPPETLKVSISYRNGYRAFGRLLISGPNTLAKAEKAAEVFWETVGGRDAYADASTQMIGWDGTHPPVDGTGEPAEVLLQFAVRDDDRAKIGERFSAQVVPRVLGTVPGITILADQGRPRPSDVVGYWPALISPDSVRVEVVVGDERVEVPAGMDRSQGAASEVPAIEVASDAPSGRDFVSVPLYELCLARSGDKGDTSNVGVIARSPDIYAWMVDNLTTGFVRDHFDGIVRGEVERHELPNLLSMNFLLHESLGGGGTASLLVDAQGKTYSQFLLSAHVEVDASLVP